MSGGWNKEKVALFKQAFADFIQHVHIASKDETGYVRIKLYNAQRRFLSEVFAGLENDIHYFVVLKARQLGISTIVRALIVFWAFMHEGLRVALIYDTDAHRNEARAEIKGFLERLPASHRIDIRTGGDNRDFLEFRNGSRISFFVAGVKKSKGSGGLGRGRGINCCGCTEVSSWGDLEGVKAFERSLSDLHPDRLYIWESTARGFEIFHSLWERAQADDLAKKAIFIGWWAKESYAYAKGTLLFERYGSDAPTSEEQKKIDIVRERYGHDVTMEQLAWYRHEFDPNVDHDSESEDEGDEITRQELPWFEEESFLMSGAQFFSVEKLTGYMAEARRVQPKGYTYFMSTAFDATIVDRARTPRMMQLKVWEEPDPEGSYVIGADPAYGSSEESNQYCAQILRCYADGLDQVGEFCTVKMETYQFAWVLAHLCGAYRNARLLLEINGPGAAVLNGFRELEQKARTGDLPSTGGMDLTHVFDHVKHYMYARQDALSRNPTGFHWITSTKLKVAVMERLRDALSLGILRVNSVECLKEMERIRRDGDSIAGDGGAQDDRVMALALAVRAWEDGERQRLKVQGRTREAERRRKQMSVADLQTLFSEQLVSSFFKQQQARRINQARQARRGTRYNF